ncbi:MAG: polysaccharide deacetylase family protein [Opitutaceae bacterium]|nr:polysaccharide deacetylase family protein [Opitutaceae bacterium]
MRPDEITAKEFDKKMQLIVRYFTPLALSEAVEKLKNNTLPQRAICVTFDDGYRDNAEIAFPILKKWNIPATFFVASGFLDGGRMWNDTIIETVRNYQGDELNLTELGLDSFDTQNNQKKEQSAQSIIQQIKHLPQQERHQKVEFIASHAKNLPNDLMMDSAQVKNMSEQNISIGGHTVTHPILATLTAEKAEQDIRQGKKALENITQKPVIEFAYPNGKPEQDYLPEHVGIVKKLGFKIAVSTQWGASNGNSDMYQLNRFTPWDKNNTKFLLRMINNLRVTG